MTNNDVLRSIRYTFDFNDSKMIALFALADLKVNRALISQWLKKEEDPDYKVCKDVELSYFLNGLIIDKRGKKEGPQPIAEQKISNNTVLKKLKIALDFKSEDMISVLQLSGLDISNHELTAFFRKPEHRNFKKCKDQVLRNFLKGLQVKFRPSPEA